MKKRLARIAKITGLTVLGLAALLLLWPLVFPGQAAEHIKRWANQHIEGELNFSSVRLSFFEHFPTLTLTLRDFSLTGAAPFEGDTLLAGKALGLGMNLASLFGGAPEVHSFYIDEARINVQVDTAGRANYNIYKGSGDTTAAKQSPDSSGARLKIAGIFFKRCHLTYHDRSIPLRIEARDFSYSGRGDLAGSQFDLQSDMEAAGFDFEYDGTAYIQNRRLKADLVTGINTRSLVFRFTKNNLLLNALPVDFNGDMAIVQDGYDIDVHIVSGTTDFGNVFSALPPEYDAWFAQTKFSGLSQIRVAMQGKYRAATGENPNLAVNLWVRDGAIQHAQAPAALDNVWINGAVHLPGLNPDSLRLTLDTLMFTLDGHPTKAALEVRGIDQPYLRARLDSRLDLDLLDRALGLSAADLQGRLELRLDADGRYRTGQNPAVRRPGTIILAIPTYELQAELQGGYLKYRESELPIRDLVARLRSACTTGKPADIRLQLDTLHAALGEGRLAARGFVQGLEKSAIKAELDAALQLQDIARAIPLDSFTLRGAFRARLRADGIYDEKQKKFPIVNGELTLQDGFLQTPYYPNPLENIQLKAGLESRHGGYNDLILRLQPLTFSFEKQKFTLNATFQDPDNLRYDLNAKGRLDLGRLYQVFAVKGYAISGLLDADLAVRGSEADAAAGHYDRIEHRGTLRVQNLEMRSDNYPAPFLVPASTLRFEHDKAWLSDAVLRYRNTEFTLNGYAQNFIGHALGGSTLLGRLTVRCPRLVVDDFMSSAPATPPPGAPSGKTPATTPAAGQGVVLLPADMDLTLEATVGKIEYGSTHLENFDGKLTLKNGGLNLEKTQFNLAGATFAFDGSYTPRNTRRADFTFHVRADSFDVQRAYREIPLFREMAGAAEKAAGLVSLEYNLKGRLNHSMEPVYPALTGQGVLKLERVQINGLKLFGAVSKASGTKEINDPELKAVVMKSSVANNILTIERTRMKVHGFRPRLEGQVSLDGRLNLRFRLGLPPLGIIGIPMTITGSSDDPQVELRKGKETDELEGEEAEEEAGEGEG